jgi:TatD DNase family protein
MRPDGFELASFLGSEVEGLLPETRYVGEIGLDGSANYRQHAAIQTKCFDFVLRASARAGGRILTIHSRGAPDDVMDALARHSGAEIPVLHWFSGTKTQLRRAVDMGCWFSVGPAMLQGRKGIELLAAMPGNRVLTETDGPFATRCGSPLQPGEVEEAILACAAVWQTDASEATLRIKANFRRIVSAVGVSAEPATFGS